MMPKRYGLQTTTMLNGVVVEQFVLWAPGKPTDWTDPVPRTPTGLDGPRLKWGREGRAEMDGVQAVDAEHWTWRGKNGVAVDFVEIPMQPARRSDGGSFGDVGLLVMMLTLTVGLGQLNYLFQALVGTAPAVTQSVEPSPELIARLLKKQFSGAEDGPVARVQRPESVDVLPSFYLPAGSVGPADRAGGGERAGEAVRRQPPITEDIAQTPASGRQETPVGHIDPLVEEAPQPLGIEGLVEVGSDAGDAAEGMAPSIERFIGWGFHDWFDVAEANQDDTTKMTDRLDLARQLMKIDPDEPYAIMTVAYYAYLSENYELCRALYHKYIRLYPEDAAGWNNLALTYKRSGEYREEERLYRTALALEPENSNTRNNLAVNLAHQGRFREAEALMDQLRPDPSEVPYAELHRAKIAAAQGRMRKAQRHLKKALGDIDKMDTFHHIEFRQDIRLDPSLNDLRKRSGVKALLRDTYGDNSPLTLGGASQLNRGPNG